LKNKAKNKALAKNTTDFPTNALNSFVSP